MGLSSISACLMTNGADLNLLRKCLESIKDEVDELAMVNTAKEADHPCVALAREVFGDRALIKHSPWGEDFSFHRNETLALATKDWCLIIDSDEIVDPMGLPPEQRNLRKWLAEAPAEYKAVAIDVMDVRGSEEILAGVTRSARIFRRGQVRYIEPIHNLAKFDGTLLHCPFLVIRHYGYGLDEETMKAKWAQRNAMLLAQLAKKPEPRLYYYLGVNAGMVKDHHMTVVYFEKYLEYYKPPSQMPGLMTNAFFGIVRAYLELKNVNRAHFWATVGSQRDPGHLDLAMAVTEVGLVKNDPVMVIVGARRYIQLFDAYIRDPAAMGTRMVLTFRADLYATQLARLWMAAGMEILAAQNELEKVLPTIKLERHAELYNDLRENFGGTGLQKLINLLPMPLTEEECKIDGLLKFKVEEAMAAEASAPGLAIDVPDDLPEAANA